MNNSLNLSIKKPCGEKFEGFKQTTKGGYCSSCQKEVTDFTKLSPQEIIDLISTSDKKICGYLHEKQLKNYALPHVSNLKQNISYFGTKIAGAIIFSFLSISKSKAQSTIENPVNPVHQDETNSEDSSSIDSISTNRIISGSVLDLHNEEPLPFASVALVRDGENIAGTMTDFDGGFTFKFPYCEGDFITVTYVGYQPLKIKRTRKDLSVTNLKMRMDSGIGEFGFMGEVSVDEVYSSKASVWQRLKMKFK
jgi:hypothetical protein